MTLDWFLNKQSANWMRQARALGKACFLHKLSTDITNSAREDKVFELIAKYQPVASDLRTIKSYMKIAYDMERFGRYAWDISLAHERLAKSAKCAPHMRAYTRFRLYLY